MAKPPVAKYCIHTIYLLVIVLYYYYLLTMDGFWTYGEAGPHGCEHGEGAAVAHAGVTDRGEQASRGAEDLHHLRGRETRTALAAAQLGKLSVLLAPSRGRRLLTPATRSLPLTTVPNQRWIRTLTSSPGLVTWVSGVGAGAELLKNTWYRPSWNMFCVICSEGK